MSYLDPVNTNYDFKFYPDDDDADGTTTNVLDVPQEDMPPEDFGK